MTREEYEVLRAGTMAEHNLNTAGVVKMSEREILQEFQALSDKIAVQNHMIPAEVLSQQLAPNEYAYQQGLSIVMNSDMIKPDTLNNPENLKEMQDSLFHENGHLRDFESSFLSEVRGQMTPEELAGLNDRLSEIPDDSWESYYNHPGEISAREAGRIGVEEVERDQQLIAEVDAAMNGGRNQILATFDFAVVNGEVVYEDTFEMSNALESQTMDTSGMQTLADNDGMIEVDENELEMDTMDAVDDFSFSAFDEDV
ncbi:hypothetical protein ACTM9K_13630 [Bariatricus sp. HCP3S3_E12]|uniref:hypothetical protein n=1 Tax=Bariatricus sp. HCP3S3_E12 TaxID=3438906 RepID=UPI003F88D356